MVSLGLDRALFPTLPAQWDLVVAAWRERTAEDGTLGSADAEDLLAHTERWVLGTDDGHVELFLTDDGYAEPWERWYDSALPLASTLDLTVASDYPTLRTGFGHDGIYG